MLAITSYYNPFHGDQRRKNYETFRKHLDIELLTVEWSREEDFDLSEQDADYLIQVSGGDLLWQKERLLNIGLCKARELGASRVAFLDCDIVFPEANWHDKVIAALDDRPLVQCYSQINYLPPVDHSGMPRDVLTAIQPVFTRPSLAHELVKFGKFLPVKWEKNNPNLPVSSLAGNPGMAVAIHLEKHSSWKNYEGNIVGGGDGIFIAGATNHLDDLFSVRSFSPAHRQSIRAWKAENFPNEMQLGYAHNEIFHLWHGEIEKRQYIDRHLILAAHEYDPAADLNLETSGALLLAQGKEKIGKDIADYLMSREDF